MSAVEYSLIFLSIVVSYVVTVAMVGWGKLIKYYDFKKFSADYLLWSLFLFLYLLYIWIWTFSYHLAFLGGYFWFTLIMIRPLLIYFCLEVLVPDSDSDYDFSAHFSASSKKFFILLTVLWSYEIALKLLMQQELFNSRGVLYFINLPISLSLIFVKSQRYHRVFAVISLAIMLMAVINHMRDQFLGR